MPFEIKSLKYQLLLELRRLYATNKPVYFTQADKINELLATLQQKNVDFDLVRHLVLQDAALSASVIQVANCTIKQGLGRKRVLSISEALGRIGVQGVRSAIAIFQLEMYKKKINTVWSKDFETSMDDIREVSNDAFNMSLEYDECEKKAELAMLLSVLYGSSICANILAASSLAIPAINKYKKVILKPASVTSCVVLLINNGHHDLIKLVESIEQPKSKLLSVSVAKAAWKSKLK